LILKHPDIRTRGSRRPIANAMTPKAPMNEGMLTSAAASPSRSLRAASAMAQAPISGNAMICADVWNAPMPPNS